MIYAPTVLPVIVLSAAFGGRYEWYEAAQRLLLFAPGARRSSWGRPARTEDEARAWAKAHLKLHRPSPRVQ